MDAEGLDGSEEVASVTASVTASVEGGARAAVYNPVYQNPGFVLGAPSAGAGAGGGTASIAGVAAAHGFARRLNGLRHAAAVDATMYQGHELPTGWEQAWLGAAKADSSRGSSHGSGVEGLADVGGLHGLGGINGGGRAGGGSGEGEGSRGELPVCVFMSSMAGDRKIAKDCRWVLDFLRNKRVPFEVVDFAATPEGRRRMAQISGDENSPLPQVQFDQQSLSIDRLKDLEDHDELNPKLSKAVRRYAESGGAS